MQHKPKNSEKTVNYRFTSAVAPPKTADRRQWNTIQCRRNLTIGRVLYFTASCGVLTAEMEPGPSRDAVTVVPLWCHGKNRHGQQVQLGS
ncbi:hypothetical protein E3N88_36353 [Mikania micrantha]|uniref:Uncharacterized protein n=1 Tax=Mikania micrantha TaxID=192012 RepID=A0A5N6M6A4_9ASTR|nr:hypothetical protein E3N88_36353 [Mikania micrantha]